MRVWIFQTGEPLPIDKDGFRQMRAANLAEALIRAGHTVEIWSADFNHFTKTHRRKDEASIRYSENLSLNLIPSIGYKSHFGLFRILDHIQLGLNLRKKLRNSRPPDVAFVGYPPIEPAWVLSRWLSKHDIPFIVDVKDLWPDIYLRAFPRFLEKFITLIIFPYKKMMIKILRLADGISAPSEEFLNFCKSRRASSDSIFDCVNPLTTTLPRLSKVEQNEGLNWLTKENVFQTNKLKIGFVGTLNKNADFDQIIEASSQLDIELVIAGDGPILKSLETKTRYMPNVKLLGWISQIQSSALISRSDLMLIPFKPTEDFQMIITNKFYDSISHGKPILTSLSGALGALIDKYQIGIVYEPRNTIHLMNTLSELQLNRSKIVEMGTNAKKLYDMKFNFESVYGSLVKTLEVLHDK
jgi:glycosyltransferase involved in cell wall biosynthesis